jgi:trimeric autotransporter adhesin
MGSNTIKETPMKISMTRRLARAVTALVGVAYLPLMNVPVASANPSGEQVVAGSASFNQNGSTLTITTSDRAIINWQDFSIGLGETTKFLQPGANSATLNRVVSGNLSEILGDLSANGKIYLINPNGIVIGDSAKINTSSFIASTLDVSNEEFMNKKELNFFATGAGTTSTIINRGEINAVGGDIFLLSNSLENYGSLNAKNGHVGLGAGREILLRETGDQRMSIKPATLQEFGNKGIENPGTIKAANIELKSAGGNAYALAMNNSGLIQATGTKQVDGKVFLVADGGDIQNSGTIEASKSNGDGGSIFISGGMGSADKPSTVINTGQILAKGSGSGTKGGEIQFLGEQVGLFDGTLDVSGPAGGGTALVGGDYQGTNPDVQNAAKTIISPTATLRADATEAGDGGKVIVWADDTTAFQGSISARGGDQGGNGGFVEVSGKENLMFDGFADVAATAGLDGTVLLDPNNLTISDDGSDNGSSGTGGIPQINFGTIGINNDMFVSPSRLQQIQGNVELRARESIFVEANVNFSNQTSGESVVFKAGDDIIINASLSTAGASITLNSSNNDAGTASSHGIILISSAGRLSTSGTVTLNSRGQSPSTIHWQNSDGSVTVDNRLAGIIVGGTINSGALNMTANTGDIHILPDLGAVNGPTITSTGNTNLKALAGNDIIIGSAGAGSINMGTLLLTAQDVLIFEDAAMNISTSNISGDAFFVSADNITDGGIIKVGGNALFRANNGAANITIDNSGATFGSLAFEGNNVVFRNLGGGINLNESTANGTLTLATANGDITSDAKITSAGTTTIEATGNNINLGNSANTFGTLLVKGNNISLNETGDTTFGASAINGQLTVISTGNITDTGAVTAQSASLRAGSGINLDTTTFSGNLNVLDFGTDLTLATTTVGGNLSINKTGALNQATALQAGGGISITSSGNLIVNNTLTIGNGNDVSLTSSGGSLTLGGAINGTIRNLSLQAFESFTTPRNFTTDGALSIAVTGGDLTIANALVGQNVVLSAANNLSQNNTVTAGQNASLTSNNALTVGSAITAGQTTTLSGGSVVINSSPTTHNLAINSGTSMDVTRSFNQAGDLSIVVNNGSLNVNNAQSGQNVTLSASHALTLNNPITAAQSLNLGFGEILNLNSTTSQNALNLASRTSFDLTHDLLLGNGDLSISTVGSFTQSSQIEARNVQLTSVNGNITIDNTILASGDLSMESPKDILLNSPITGSTVILHSDGFINTAGTTPINASDRFLIYVSHSNKVQLGGMTGFDFETFGIPFPLLPVQSGSGFLYTQITLADFNAHGPGSPDDEDKSDDVISRIDLTQFATTLQYGVEGNPQPFDAPALISATSFVQ